MIKEEGFLLLVFSGVTGHGRMVVLFLRGNGGKVEHHRLRGEAAHFTVAREQRARVRPGQEITPRLSS